MNTRLRNPGFPSRRLATSLALVVLAAAALSVSGGAAAHGGEIHRPASAEFGPGPRHSSASAYVVTLMPREPLRLRRLQSVEFSIADVDGRPVENASISIDGGMPEHGHGLPTQPSIAPASASGVYRIEGLRFSMGGWWQLKLVIDSPAGQDRVTFNLDL